MSRDEEKHENVVSIAEARRRQRTVQKAANGRDQDGGRGGHKSRAGASSGKDRAAPTGGRKIWAYVQFILFLAVLAYFMQLCRSGG